MLSDDVAELTSDSADEVQESNAEIGDEELDSIARSKADLLAQRRLNHEAIFGSWFTIQAQNAQVQKTPVSKSRRAAAEPGESLKEILQKREDLKHIIGSERAYQTELFERAKQQNTIAVLDTGSGKTLISILLLKHVLDQEVEDRAAGKPQRIAIFIVHHVTLMLQQAAVLRANLSYTGAEICGDMNHDLWDKDKWHDTFSKNDYIVCTADVLLHCLRRAFLKIDQLNLLVIDEAHHAKNRHPFASIMREFYPRFPRQTDVLPRIFGMTASPVDVRGSEDIDLEADALQYTLHANIATTQGSEVDKHVSRPQEEIVTYLPSPNRFDSDLFRLLRARYHDLTYFKGLFITATIIKAELGPWCSDAFWQFAFSESVAEKLQAKRWYKQSDGGKDQVEDEGKLEKFQATMDKQIADFEVAAADIRNHEIVPLHLSSDHLSLKVLRLHEVLKEYYERPTDARCLVFVEQKMDARLLKEVFDRIGGPYMKAGSLVGSTRRGYDAVKNTFKEQFFTLHKFKSGEINCLFATTVAEEGLDVPDCNLVVRFHPCTTMIQYIQSRGRARHRNSKFIHLIKGETDGIDEDKLRHIKESEDRMRWFCRALPEERKLLGNEASAEDLEETVDKHETIRDKETGASVNFFFSIIVLQQFVDSIPRDEGDDMSIAYSIFKDGNKFRCEVSLPDRARMPSVTGGRYPRKLLAKMSAALKVCKRLKEQELLDGYFLSTVKKELHHMRNAKLALKSKDRKGYETQLKPSIWAQERGNVPDALYMAVICLSEPWDRPLRSFFLLTRHPLPELPTFPIYPLDNREVMVKIENLPGSVRLAESTIAQMTWFMLTIFKDIFNKVFENNPANMSYWLAPMSQSVEKCTDAAEELLDLDFLRDNFNKTSYEWTPDMSEGDIVDHFLVDPYHGGRRYFTSQVVDSLRPSDPVPQNSALDKKKAKSIIDYTSSLWAASRARKIWNEEQPVLRADRILHRLNVLATASESERDAVTACYICPEPLRISRLSIPIVNMALIFPAIIHRVEAYLLALEFNLERGLEVEPALALEALTKDSDNSEEHEEEKIAIRHGMGPNYERLEFLGDAFLKMATSIAIYMRNPGKNEHWMHADRMQLLCNKTLMENAIGEGVPKFVRAMAFSRRTWYPEGLKLIEGKGSNKDADSKCFQPLSGKTIADVCEATMGAALLTHLRTGYEPGSCMDNAVRAVTTFVSNQDLKHHSFQCWDDYYKAYKLPEYQTQPCSAADVKFAERVQKSSHPYAFKHPKLLQSAMTHPCYPSAHTTVPNYQRLEFLGDSLLDLTIAWYLFIKYPTKDPGWLTEHKMPMVSNKFMGALGAKLGLHRHMRHHSPILQNQLTAYDAEFREAMEKDNVQPDFWMELKDPPKFFADVVEAYVGAMFVDSEFNYAEVQRFFDMHILPFFGDMEVYDTFANNHPTNRLRERLEVQMGCENWRLMSQELMADDEKSSVMLSTLVIHKKTLGRGQASTPKVAKHHAAVDAFNLLEGITPHVFRMEYGCNCELSLQSGTNGVNHVT